jgi:hypothetical protein
MGLAFLMTKAADVLECAPSFFPSRMIPLIGHNIAKEQNCQRPRLAPEYLIRISADDFECAHSCPSEKCQ